jgi:hypothetical protein
MNNVGENALSMEFVGKVCDITLVNFLDNTGSVSLIKTTGQWGIKRCVFLRNKGTLFMSMDDTLLVRNSFIDGEKLANVDRVEIGQDVQYGKGTPTIPITDALHGFCPGQGTPMAVRVSPTPAKTVITEKPPVVVPEKTQEVEKVVIPSRTGLEITRMTLEKPTPYFKLAMMIFCGVMFAFVGCVVIVKQVVGARLGGMEHLLRRGHRGGGVPHSRHGAAGHQDSESDVIDFESEEGTDLYDEDDDA